VTVPGPAILKLTQTHRIWRERASTTRKKDRTPVGTTFTLTLNQNSTLLAAFWLRSTGRRAHHECVAASRANRHAVSCTRWVPAPGMTRAGHAGTNALPFAGAVGSHRLLAPGFYKVVFMAVDAAGQSKPATLNFQIKR
jgi:hypothetical protein